MARDGQRHAGGGRAVTQLYICGVPNGWKGVCESNGDGYLYHEDWPERSTQRNEFLSEVSLARLLAEGFWKPLIHEDLMVEVGL